MIGHVEQADLPPEGDRPKRRLTDAGRDGREGHGLAVDRHRVVGERDFAGEERLVVARVVPGERARNEGRVKLLGMVSRTLEAIELQLRLLPATAKHSVSTTPYQSCIIQNNGHCI